MGHAVYVIHPAASREHHRYLVGFCTFRSWLDQATSEHPANIEQFYRAIDDLENN